jgi:dTDP-4-amino-4,6-dideoxygalactose transaminase
MLGLKIPFIGLQKQYHNLRQEILDATDQVLRSGQVMNGNWTAEFENWLAKKNKVKYAVTCHSGTQALEIIASYCRSYYDDLDPSPCVLIPAMTYPATANAFIKSGWTPHIVDVDRYGIMNLHNVSAEQLKRSVVCAVGLFGAYFPHARFATDKYTPGLIEDAAQHWLSANCQRIGAAAAISFDPTKNLGNFGNGGAVLTSNTVMAQYARNWRDNGKTEHWDVPDQATNSRMSEVDCAQMMVKTRYIDQWQRRRRDIAKYWMERLQNSPVRCLIDSTNVDQHCFHKFVIDVDRRDQVQGSMNIRRVETRIHYEKPLQEMRAYAQYPAPDLLSSSSALCRRVLSLPIYPELTDLEVEYIIDQLRDCVEQERN